MPYFYIFKDILISLFFFFFLAYCLLVFHTINYTPSLHRFMILFICLFVWQCNTNKRKQKKEGREEISRQRIFLLIPPFLPTKSLFLQPWEFLCICLHLNRDIDDASNNKTDRKNHYWESTLQIENIVLMLNWILLWNNFSFFIVIASGNFIPYAIPLSLS